MKTPSLRVWAVDQPIKSPFALPSGWLGALAGRHMLWTNSQHELLPLLDLKRGQRVLEVGYGPGGLVRLLVAQSEAAHITGVDLSDTMLRAASRLNRRAIAQGRVQLALGSAEQTGLASESFERVVSVCNVALWPDLEAGLAELARVCTPGGRIVLAWHGGHARSRLSRSLRLPADKLERLRSAIARQFEALEQHDLATKVVFCARKPDSQTADAVREP
jgi:ubiquinone/menaquinone biosynthesis C-methylase UbiE